jgi:capsular polysaccharide biosynthesis protein
MKTELIVNSVKKRWWLIVIVGVVFAIGTSFLAKEEKIDNSVTLDAAIATKLKVEPGSIPESNNISSNIKATPTIMDLVYSTQTLDEVSKELKQKGYTFSFSDLSSGIDVSHRDDSLFIDVKYSANDEKTTKAVLETVVCVLEKQVKKVFDVKEFVVIQNPKPIAQVVSKVTNSRMLIVIGGIVVVFIGVFASMFIEKKQVGK